MARRKNSIPFGFKKLVVETYDSTNLSGKECLEKCLAEWNETHDKKVTPSTSWFAHTHSILHGWRVSVKNGPKVAWEVQGSEGDEYLIVNGVKYKKVVEKTTKK